MSFLTDNIKLILHLRQRLHRDNMLGLCLGAGVSADFSFPTWPELIKRIAEREDIQGTRLLKISQSLISQSQFLFQKYKQSLESREESTGDDVVDNRRAAMGWLNVVHNCLYSGSKVDDTSLKSHPFLWDLIPLIKQSAMTVNYNFDDTIERMLYLYNEESQGELDDKGFEVVWQPSIQFRRHKGVIYHPNGFLPYRKTDGLSEQIVFMEQEYADQLIDVTGGHYACLLNHLSKHTLIFLGLSLNDTTLKHLLRVSARSCPGSIHYHIHWCNGEKPSTDEQTAIRKANFSVYNLITLFLTTDEIKDLANFIMMDKEAFESACDAEPDGVKTIFRYYVTGSVGTGKSTVVGQIRCIDSFDEWVDRKHQLLPKPHEELTTEERKEIDGWINQQFRKKNRRITYISNGLSIIDRSPLDPLYFVSDIDALRVRAKELLNAMVPSQGQIKEIAPGHLIVLTCNKSILKTRLANRQKTYSIKQLKDHQAMIDTFWKSHETTLIDTTNLSVEQVVSRILASVFFLEYHEISFHKICKSFLNGDA